MIFSLKGKVIVITGGSGLLGQRIIQNLLENGAYAINADVKFGEEEGHKQYLDITNEDSVKNGVSDIINRYGKIDGWVNNAYPRTSDWGNKVENVPFESWRTNVDMHLNGYFLCSKIVLEHMKLQGYGSLINMASIYGIVAPDFTIYKGTNMTMPVAYSAIKGGIISLTRYLAAYYGPYQVRINSLSPGGIFDNQPTAFVDAYCDKVPLKRMGNPDDIYSSVHFLLADESCYMTGQNMVVDGGWSII